MSDSEDFELVSNPSLSVDVGDVEDVAGTPAAAPAAATPPDVKRQRAASTTAHMQDEVERSERSNGRASSVTAAIMGCSLNEPKLEATLQYESVPLDKSTSAKLRVDVTPSEHRPKPSVVDVVLCLDASGSMGRTSVEKSGAALLKAFLIDFLTFGVSGKNLNLRILEFGENVIDHRFSEHEELVRLDDSSREKFLAIANRYEPSQGCTNISDPVIRGIQAIRDHHAGQRKRGLTPAEVAHVICLTDGAANAGITDGAGCLGAAQHAMGQTDVFVHYIGLGGHVNAKFMTSATAKGDAGVFAVAPDGSQIPQAFEEVFGFALGTTLPLTLEITDAKGTRVEKKGMLIKERSLLLDVQLMNRKEACVAKDVSVRLMIAGQALTERREVAINYTGDDLGTLDPKVKELVDSEALHRKVEDLTSSAPSLEAAGQAIHDLVRQATETNAYSVASLQRVAAMAVDAEESAIKYRNLGANGPRLYAAKSLSQKAYSQA